MKRLPIIRHLRWLYGSWQVSRHYAMWGELGYQPFNIQKDIEVLDAIWRGER